MLQDGYTVPSFVRQGIWYFNELIWASVSKQNIILPIIILEKG
jgi:hypothetical protein